MARLLITRPEHDAGKTARRLTDLGHDAIIAPLMNVHFLSGPVLDLDGVQAVLVTSANGLRAFVARQGGAVAGLPVLAVGDATARAARDAGFDDVASAGGDVDDLARLVRERMCPDGGPLLHVAGTKLAGDLAGMLTEDGFTCRREVLYEARAAEILPDSARDALSGSGIDGVLIYSPRTAALFRDLADASGLGPALAGVTAYCLSANVAAKVGAPWARVIVATRPTEDSLIEALQE